MLPCLATYTYSFPRAIEVKPYIEYHQKQNGVVKSKGVNLESGFIPTWEAAPCISRFKLGYSHVLLLPIELIHTKNQRRKIYYDFSKKIYIPI